MKQLAFDDLYPNLIVTVAQPRRYETSTLGLSGMVSTVTHQDNSYVGDILRIVAVDPPLVVVQTVWTRRGKAPLSGGIFDETKPFVLDPSAFRLWKPDREYMKALGFPSDMIPQEDDKTE